MILRNSGCLTGWLGLSILVSAPLAFETAAQVRSGDAEESSQDGATTGFYGDPLPANAVARLGSNRLRVPGEVKSIAWSPDGELIAAGFQSGRLRNASILIWEAKTGRPVQRIPSEGRSVSMSVRFSSDSKRIVSSGLYGGASWDVKTGKKVELEASNGVLAPDSKTRITRGTDNRQLKVWDVGTNEQIATIQVEGHKNGIRTRTFSPNSATLATGTYDGQLHLWQVRTGKKLFQLPIPKSLVAQVRFTPDGKLLAAAGYLGGIYLFDTASGKLHGKLPAHGRSPITAMIVSPDGKRIASAGRDDDAVQIWEISTGKQVGVFERVMGDVNCLGFSPDGAKLAVGGRQGFSGGRLRIWDVGTGKEEHVLPGHTGAISSVVFSPDGYNLATAGSDGTVRLWETTSGKQLLRLQGDGSQALAFSPDGWVLAAVGRNGTYKFWEVETADELVSRSGNSLSIRAKGIALSPELDLLALGTDRGTVSLLQTATGKTLRQIEAQPGREVGAVAFSPDGLLVAAASGRNRGRKKAAQTITVWDVQSGRKVHEFKNADVGDDRTSSFESYERLLFAPDGAILAAQHSKGVLHLWDAQRPGRNHAIALARGTAITFSPDGKTLVLTTSQGDVRLIEVATGQSYRELPGTGQPVTSVAVSPNGRLLATALSGVNTVLVWSLAPPKLATAPDDDQIRDLWDKLIEHDAATAHKVMWSLVAAKQRTVVLLQGRFDAPPNLEKTKQRVRDLIRDLDNNQFTVRRKASSELRKLGTQAEPQLRRTLEGTQNAEVRQRIRVLLTALTSPLQKYSGEPLRRIRAIQVLERIGTERAVKLLEKLAQGSATARETIDAKAALGRIRAVERGR